MYPATKDATHVFNVCQSCGMYSVEKEIDPSGPFAICPTCGHRHRFLQLPLFIVTGASGAGKTSLCLELVHALKGCVVLETDILWRPEFATPEDNYRGYREMWLRVAKNVSQAGRPVVLCGSATPEQFEVCSERRYFAALHYLVLVCDDDALAQRLRSRPNWRQSQAPEFVERMVRFNRWLKENAAATAPPMTLLDTTSISIDEATKAAAAWVRDRLGGVNRPFHALGRSVLE